MAFFEERLAALLPGDSLPPSLFKLNVGLLKVREQCDRLLCHGPTTKTAAPFFLPFRSVPSSRGVDPLVQYSTFF